MRLNFVGSLVDNKYRIEKLNLRGERQEVCAIFGDSYPLKLIENELVVYVEGDTNDKCIRFYCLLK